MTILITLTHIKREYKTKAVAQISTSAHLQYLCALYQVFEYTLFLVHLSQLEFSDESLCLNSRLRLLQKPKLGSHYCRIQLFGPFHQSDPVRIYLDVFDNVQALISFKPTWIYSPKVHSLTWRSIAAWLPSSLSKRFDLHTHIISLSLYFRAMARTI